MSGGKSRASKHAIKRVPTQPWPLLLLVTNEYETLDFSKSGVQIIRQPQGSQMSVMRVTELTLGKPIPLTSWLPQSVALPKRHRHLDSNRGSSLMLKPVHGKFDLRLPETNPPTGESSNRRFDVQ